MSVSRATIRSREGFFLSTNFTNFTKQNLPHPCIPLQYEKRLIEEGNILSAKYTNSKNILKKNQLSALITYAAIRKAVFFLYNWSGKVDFLVKNGVDSNVFNKFSVFRAL
jgi:hypothetical protein